MVFIAVRLRSGIAVGKSSRDTMSILGMKKINTLVVLPENPSVTGMLRKIDSFITYGKVSDEDAKGFERIMRLKPPKGGLKSIRKKYPQGDLGYRGESILDFVKVMM